MSLVFLLVIATTPGIAIAVFIYYKDHHEPEPVNLVIISYFLGALALLIAYALTLALNNYLTIDPGNIQQQAIRAFLSVAFIEEISKFIFLRWVLYPNHNFNEPLDGIVYSVMVAMGFATAENIVYVLDSGGGTAILRMFTAIPAHAMFAVLMGYFLGKAKFTHQKEITYALAALAVATIFHGLYDYFIFISFIPGVWLFAVASLVVAFVLSRKAIALHQEASPFKPGAKGNP